MKLRLFQPCSICWMSRNPLTIDAMGCQRSLTKKIQDKGADYVLALKGNPGLLNDEVRLFLESEAAKPASTAISAFYSESDTGHGRIESRQCIVSNPLDGLAQKSAWAGLSRIALIEETREFKGRIRTDRRFFISRLPANAQQISLAVRAHGAIENTRHWTRDVVFNEDQSTVHKDHAPQNMAIVRHVVLNLLNTTKKHLKNIGIKALRKKAGGAMPIYGSF